MSDSNGFATKDKLEKYRGKRRFEDFDWLDIGKVVIQSATAREFIRIDSCMTRARIAAAGGQTKEHEQAMREYVLLTCQLLVLDQEHNPFFSPADSELILALDSAAVDVLVGACAKHCEADAIALADAQKKSLITTGSSSPTEYGET